LQETPILSLAEPFRWPSTSGGWLQAPPSPVSSAAMSAAASLSAVVKEEGASVRVLLPDRAGSLRVAAALGEGWSAGRRRSSRRRQAFESGQRVQVQLREPSGYHLSILPLVAAGETVGVIELIASADRSEQRQDAILALVRQSAALVKLSMERAESQRSIDGMARLLTLASELNQAMTPVAAMLMVAEGCRQQINGPVAVVRPDRSRQGWFLGAGTGLGARRRAELRRAVALAPRSGRREAQRRRLARAFAGATGQAGHVLDAGAAALIVPLGAMAHHAGFLSTASSLLEQELTQRAGLNRTSDLDVGIAWTAHELKAPLVGARAALEHVMTSQSDPTLEGADLLRSTRDELGRLSELIDPLLRWSAGRGSLRKRRADLVQVVRDAVRSSVLAGGGGRVVVQAPPSLYASIDPVQLRAAFANVIRNALAYSQATVVVRVENRDTVARVSIRDRGPSIRPEERDAIFEPFVRGSQAGGRPGGRGLGLFIARRVAEAHGGYIRLEPRRVGASFSFEIPLGTERRRASAS